MIFNKETQDIFRKLSRGCSFSKEKTKKIESKKRPLEDNVEIKVEIKQEPLDEDENSNEAPIRLLSSMETRENVPKLKKRKVLDEAKVAALKQEKINQYRNELKLSVIGRHVPEPMRAFEDMDLKQQLLKNVIMCGYSEPTPIQQQAIPIMLSGRQILALAPTGSGKSLAFLLPVLQALKKPKRKGFRAVILCPTRELAKQTQMLAMRLTDNMGFHIHIMSKINKTKQLYGEKSTGNYDVLITTPKRLCYLLKQEPPAINLSNVEWLIADEADKYFEESSTESFLDQFKLIYDACSPEKRKIAFFAATYTPKAVKWCVHNIKGLIRVTLGTRNSAVESVEQHLTFVGGESGKLVEFRNMVREGFEPPVLIFVQSKERAQQLHKELLYENLHIDVIHGDLNQNERDLAIRKFRNGESWILICTELMSRGIDFKGVNLVINWDFPQTTISYIHRIGRSGRAGRRGKAVTFYTEDDLEYVAPIGYIMKQSGNEVPDFILSLKKPTKKKKKQLKVSAPKREQISTTPLYETIIKNKKKRYIMNSKQKCGAKSETSIVKKDVDGNKSKPKKKVVKSKTGVVKKDVNSRKSKSKKKVVKKVKVNK